MNDKGEIVIDINADLGEGLSTDADLMPFISSANIACGFHAGDEATMRNTVSLCMHYGLAIGAHPSYPDRKYFGRAEMNLPCAEVKSLITEQLYLLQKVCDEMGAEIHHVKPHGALYNMSARNAKLAEAIAEAVFAFNPSLILFGLSGSHSVAEGVMAGLKTAAEVFADRTYQEDGSLTHRSLPHACIDSDDAALAQAIMLIETQQVKTVGGSVIPLMAETLCLHGDGPHAISFARNIHQSFTQRGIRIQAI